VRSVRFAFALLFLVFLGVLCFFIYQAIANTRNVPAEVQNSPDFTIALRSAERVRFVELLAAAVLFPITAYFLAIGGAPRASWLRNLLGAFFVFLLVFVVFAKYMESSFQNTFPSAPLPLTALQTAGFYAAGGILLVWLLFFATERIHAWRVAK
jgi:hypothetical protein